LPEVEYQLLRIAQEAISNALRHARAKTLEIRLHVDEEQLGLTFADDGIGFTTDVERAEAGHFGLLGMRERADEIGAGLTVTSSPGHGTEVSIHVPISQYELSEGNADRAFEHQVK
jgi:signal transduction histidine kinase